jgi:NAD(P)-dependent dehydrogenase (short-subunit alcohol dehydrogenase family)
MARTWLITGASAGLGRTLVEAVLDHGDHVVAASRRPEQLADLAVAGGDRLLTVALDVTDPEAARAVVARAVEAFGSLDVVVNNAGYATIAPIEEFDEQEFRAQIETNLFGVVNVTRAALPVLREQRSGHVVQISSVGGRVGGSPGLAAYQAAKFGVAGFSEVLANEVAPLGIRVTVVEPGGMRTGWAAGAAGAAAPVGADYQETVGEGIRFRTGYAGNEPSDPARVAQVLVDLVDAGEAPRRLVIGRGALESARRSAAERAAEMESWAHVSRSTDFPATATSAP